jgi:hypothetical protein
MSTTKVTYSMIDGAPVNVKDFGAVGDGVTDDTAAFTNAIAYCKTLGTGSTLMLNGLSYKLTSRQTVDFSDFVIDGGGADITWAGTGLDSLYTGVFQFVGSLSATSTTVSVDEPEYTNTLTVSSVTGFAVGNLIQIDSASSVSPGVYVNITAKIVKISGTTITIDVVKRLALTVSETVTVTKINAVERSGICNCNFTATGQTSRSNGMGGVYITYAANSFVENCMFSGFWFKGVKSYYCNGLSISNIRVEKPAAVSTGEGYGMQYEYTYNSVARNLSGQSVRHLFDATCAWHIIVEDSFDSNTTSASYSLHSAYEYDIEFRNCTAQGGETSSYAFALGSVSSGFSDYTDKITLSGCRALYFGGLYAVKFTSKGKGLNISNSIFEMVAGVSAKAILTANNDTFISNSQLVGGIEVAATSGTYAVDGSVNLSNCRLVTQSSQRSWQLDAGASMRMVGCTVEGLATNTSSTTLYAIGCKFVSQNTSDEFITNSPAVINAQNLYFESCTFDTLTYTKSTYTFLAETLSFVGCQFKLNITTNAPWNLYSTNVRVISCNGLQRSVYSGTYTTNLEMLGCRAIGVSGDRVVYVVSYTGKINISDNMLSGTARTNNCVDLSDAGNSISVLTFTNNILVGIPTLTDARITRCVVTGNVVDASSSTLPTAGASKFVSQNLVY